jgi:hypothetical protein
MSEKERNNEVPKLADGPSVANLYFLWTNYVSYIVFSLARDFVTRPVRYSVIGKDTADLLTEIWLKTGRDAEFPNAAERHALYTSYFGRSHFQGSLGDGSMFHRLTSELRRNAALVAEQSGGSANELVVTAFRSSASRVAQFLSKYSEGGANEAFVNTYNRLANVAQKSAIIVGRPDVAAAFGVNAPKKSKSTLETEDRNLYLLLEKITTQIPSLRAISVDQFAAAAVVASSGRLTLFALSSSRSASDFSLCALRTAKDGLDDSLVPAYSWRSSLRNLDSFHSAGR